MRDWRTSGWLCAVAVVLACCGERERSAGERVDRVPAVVFPTTAGSADAPHGTPVITAGTSGLWVATPTPVRVLELRDGQLPAKPDLGPLRERLEQAAARSKETSEGDPRRGAVRLHFDRSVPFATLGRTLEELRRAGFRVAFLTAIDGSHRVDLEASEPRFDADAKGGAADLVVAWHGERGLMTFAASRRSAVSPLFLSAGSCPSVARTAGQLEVERLQRLSASFCRTIAKSYRVTVSPTPETPVDEVAAVLAAVLQPQACGGPVELVAADPSDATAACPPAVDPLRLAGALAELPEPIRLEPLLTDDGDSAKLADLLGDGYDGEPLGGIGLEELEPVDPPEEIDDLAEDADEPFGFGLDTLSEDVRPMVLGTLEQAVVERVVERKRSAFRRCARAAFKRQRLPAGALLLSFSIGANGRLGIPLVHESTFDDERVSECVIGKMRRLRFPRPPDGEPVRVLYPLLLKAQR